MSMDLNMCQFIGRLGADPETRSMPSGDSVTQIRIAVGWKSKEKEGTEWVPLVFFGRTAEVVAQYLRKGSKVYVQGRYRTQSWEKDGQKHYRTEIVGERMQMLDPKPTNGGTNTGGQQGQQGKPGANNQQQRKPPIGNHQNDDFPPFDDNIPF